MDGLTHPPKVGEELLIAARACHTVRNVGGAESRKPVTMAYYRNLTFMELRGSMRLVEEHQGYLLERWDDYFGT
ncbi:MAG: hypothetical protein WBB42_02350 [Polyangiales bacterium]